jgi:hypothetical protein
VLSVILIQQIVSTSTLCRRLCNPNCKRKRRITESHSPYSAVVPSGTYYASSARESRGVLSIFVVLFFRYRHMCAELTIACNNDLGQYAIIFRNLFLNDLYSGNICNHYYIKNAHIMIEVVICSSNRHAVRPT